MTTPPEVPPSPPQGAAPPETPPPRAFAQGAGVLLQTVGMILFLSNCCICSLAGLWEPQMTRSQLDDWIRRQAPLGVGLSDLVHQPGKAGMMLLVTFSTVGGLALAGFGLGLQSDRPRSAFGALVTNVAMLAVLILAGVGLWAGHSSIFARLWQALLLLLVVGLLPFTIGAMRQFRAAPPPREPELLPPGFDVRDVLRGEKPSKLKIKELRAKLEIERKQLERLERELEKPPDGGGGKEDEPRS